MSYLGRLEHFKCDRCGKEHVGKGYPKNWVWVKEGIGKDITHRCEDCKFGVSTEVSVPMGRWSR